MLNASTMPVAQAVSDLPGYVRTPIHQSSTSWSMCVDVSRFQSGLPVHTASFPGSRQCDRLLQHRGQPSENADRTPERPRTAPVAAKQQCGRHEQAHHSLHSLSCRTPLPAPQLSCPMAAHCRTPRICEQPLRCQASAGGCHRPAGRHGSQMPLHRQALPRAAAVGPENTTAEIIRPVWRNPDGAFHFPVPAMVIRIVICLRRHNMP
jgi:hypothetical protein